MLSKRIGLKEWRGGAIALCLASVTLLGTVAGRTEEISIAPAEGVGPARGSDDEYRIGPTDVIDVSVWQHPDMSQSLPVRHDGKITFQLLGDVPAAGLTPSELDAELTERLREFVRNPQVTVRVAEANSRKVLVLGAVNRPGPYRLQGSPRVLEVLTEVGWKEEGAEIWKVTVLRASGEVLKVDLHALLYGGDLAQNVRLRPDDTIFLPPREEALAAAGVAGASLSAPVRILALGEVGKAGTHAFSADRPPRVKDLLLVAGGVTDRASLGRAKVIRTNGDQDPVDLNRLLFDGDMSQDLALGPGDVFYVPQARRTRFYVLGMVQNPGLIETEEEHLSVMQAIVLAQNERTRPLPSNLKIVRDWPNDPKVITVNIERLLRQGDVSQNVPLKDGDVVFVPQSLGDIALETYRKILQPIFPTASAIGTIRALESGSTTNLTTGSGF